MTRPRGNLDGRPPEVHAWGQTVASGRIAARKPDPVGPVSHPPSRVVIVTLKRELERPDSPIRRFFADRLPQTRTPRAAFRAASASLTPVLPGPVPGGGPFPDRVPWDVLGHAISARLLWNITPRALDLQPGVVTRVPTLAGISANALIRFDHDKATVGALAATIDAGPDLAGPDLAARVAWIGGLLDRAYRSGADLLDPWFDGLRLAATWEELLATVPDWAVVDVTAVHDHNIANLEALAGTTVAVDPSFAGSAAVGGADGDVIVDGVLVDIKASKEPTLRLRDLHQIVAYALLDWTDSFQLTDVGILAARHGSLVTWPLPDLLAEMAGAPVEVAELRAALRDDLGSPPLDSPWAEAADLAADSTG